MFYIFPFVLVVSISSSFIDVHTLHVTYMSAFLFRCPIYPALPASCTYVTDPKDPCCEVPSCISPNATIPTQVVNGTKGTVFIQPQLNPPVIGKRGE